MNTWLLIKYVIVLIDKGLLAGLHQQANADWLPILFELLIMSGICCVSVYIIVFLF